MDDLIKEPQSNINNITTELREINRAEYVDDADDYDTFAAHVEDETLEIFRRAVARGREDYGLRSATVSRRGDVRLVQGVVTNRILSWRLVLRRLFNNLKTKGGTR